MAVGVLTVDDQRVFRRAMAKLIEAAPEFTQVGEAASGAEALELAADLRPDLVLVDVRMPDMDGIETARRLAGVDPRPVVVLVSIDAARDAQADDRRAVERQDVRWQQVVGDQDRLRRKDRDGRLDAFEDRQQLAFEVEHVVRALGKPCHRAAL